MSFAFQYGLDDVLVQKVKEDLEADNTKDKLYKLCKLDKQSMSHK